MRPHDTHTQPAQLCVPIVVTVRMQVSGSLNMSQIWLCNHYNIFALPEVCLLEHWANGWRLGTVLSEPVFLQRKWKILKWQFCSICLMSTLADSVCTLYVLTGSKQTKHTTNLPGSCNKYLYGSRTILSEDDLVSTSISWRVKKIYGRKSQVTF